MDKEKCSSIIIEMHVIPLYFALFLFAVLPYEPRAVNIDLSINCAAVLNANDNSERQMLWWMW